MTKLPPASVLAAGLSLAVACGGPPAVDRTESTRTRTLLWTGGSNDLVARMTLEEKVAQMMHAAPAVERLGIPAYNWWNEGLHGVARAGLATVFPQAIGMAATWDVDLMDKVATAISDEARAKHHQSVRQRPAGHLPGTDLLVAEHQPVARPALGPGHGDLRRGPLSDRAAWRWPSSAACRATTRAGSRPWPHPSTTPSTAGPSPTATASMRPPRSATCENRICRSSGPRWRRPRLSPSCAPTTPSTACPAAAATGSWPASCAGSGASADMSSRTATRSTTSGPDTSRRPTAAEAAAMAVKAGTDLNCGTEFQGLLEAVRTGLISEKDIDVSVARLFRVRFRLGQFDPPESVPYASIPIAVVDSEAHRRLALEAARKSIVLLKNEGGLLPLSKSLGVDRRHRPQCGRRRGPVGQLQRHALGAGHPPAGHPGQGRPADAGGLRPRLRSRPKDCLPWRSCRLPTS